MVDVTLSRRIYFHLYSHYIPRFFSSAAVDGAFFAQLFDDTSKTETTQRKRSPGGKPRLRRDVAMRTPTRKRGLSPKEASQAGRRTTLPMYASVMYRAVMHHNVHVSSIVNRGKYSRIGSLRCHAIERGGAKVGARDVRQPNEPAAGSPRSAQVVTPPSKRFGVRRIGQPVASYRRRRTRKNQAQKGLSLRTLNNKRRNSDED